MGKFVKISDTPERQIGSLNTGTTQKQTVSKGSRGKLVVTDENKYKQYTNNAQTGTNTTQTQTNTSTKARQQAGLDAYLESTKNYSSNPGALATEKNNPAQKRQERAATVTEKDFNRRAGLRRTYGTYENYLKGTKTYDGFTDEELQDEKLGTVLEQQTHKARENVNDNMPGGTYIDKDSDAYKLYESWKTGKGRQEYQNNKVTESEFNKSTGMQNTWGTYENYLKGQTDFRFTPEQLLDDDFKNYIDTEGAFNSSPMVRSAKEATGTLDPIARARADSYNTQRFAAKEQQEIAGYESVRENPRYAAFVNMGKGLEGAVEPGGDYNELREKYEALTADQTVGGMTPEQLYLYNAELQDTIKRLEMSSWTQDEADTYNAYLAMEELNLAEKGTAEKYREALERTHNARDEEAITAAEAADAKEDPFTSSVVQAMAGMASAPAAVTGFAQELKNEVTGEYEPIDTGSNTMIIPAIKQASAQGQLAGTSEGSRWIVQQVQNIVDNGVRNLALGPLGLPVMAMGAAGQSMYQSAKEGKTTADAVTLGVQEGLEEYLTEKISFEALEKLVDTRAWGSAGQMVAAMGRQIASEGGEETANELMNTASDILTLGSGSEFVQDIKEYERAGYSKGEAFLKSANEHLIKQPLLAGAGGAVSGLFFGITGAGGMWDSIKNDLKYFEITDMVTDGEIDLKKLNDKKSGLLEKAKSERAVKAIMDEYDALNNAGVAEVIRQIIDTDIDTGANTETEVTTDEGIPNAGEERDNGDGAGGEAGGLDTGTGGGQGAVATGTGAGRANYEALLRDGKITEVDAAAVSEDGVGTVKVITRDGWDDVLTADERTAIESLEEKTGIKIRLMAENMQVRGAKTESNPEGIYKIRGIKSGNDIWVSAGDDNATAAQIARHETFHALDEKYNLRDGIKEAIRQRYSKKEFQKLVEQYIKALRGVYNADDAMSSEELRRMTDIAEKEICADAYAGINFKGLNADKYFPEATNVTETKLTEEQSSRAPPGRNAYIESLNRQLREGDIDEEEYDDLFDEYYNGNDTEDLYSAEEDSYRRKSDGHGKKNSDGVNADSSTYGTDTDTLYSYAGEKAKTANLGTLQEAQAMREHGADMESIRKATGWYQGMDGKWRFEIDDSGMKLRQTGYTIPNLIKLGELADAPELFKAYPDLADMEVFFSTLMPGENGGYDKRRNQIMLNRELRGNMDKLQDVLIHEVQHAIQQREGFTGGSSPAYWAKKIGGDNEFGEDIGSLVFPYTKKGKNIQNELEAFRNNPENAKLMELRDKMDELDIEDDAQFDEWLRLSDEIEFLGLKERDREYTNLRFPDAKRDYRTANELYRDTAGEIEARDVSKRRELTAEQRRETAPDLGSEGTVFADGGESYSIANTRSMPWEEQVREYFKRDGSIKSSDSLYLGLSNTDGIQNAPQYVPTSIITKAIRPPKGSRSAHALEQSDILNLENGIKNAPAVIYNPSRNSLVYVTDNQDSGRGYIIVTFDLNNSLYGENAHRATSIHGRKNLVPMLEKLGEDATIYVRNENKFNQMLPGNQILKSLELLAKVELDGKNVAESTPNVNNELTGKIVLPGGEEYSTAEDSEGRELTEEQAEYFKNSKVRDENGNLLVVYHGTPSKGFTVFDVAKETAGALGKGFYFSASKEYARGNTIVNGSFSGAVMEAYLDIKNPYIAKSPGGIDTETLKAQGYDGVYNPANDFWVAFYPEQIKHTDNESPTTSPDVRYSVSEIIGDDQTSYGIGVHLDSTLLENLTPKERTEMVKERVNELGGETFTAYDNDRNAVDVSIAKPEERFRNHKGKKKQVNKDLTVKYIGSETKQESVVLLNELIETAGFDTSKAPKYPHDWLDNNGQNDWDYWTTYVQDRNGQIWEVTLNVANATDGRKILYDIGPIKKVGQSIKLDTSLPSAGQSIKLDTSTAEETLSQGEKNVNNKLTGKIVLPGGEEYSAAEDSEGRELTEEQTEYFKDSKVRDENGNLLVVYHGTDAAFTVFDSSKSRINMDIQGSFFSPWEIDAGGYGPNVKAYYLNITSPADEGTAYKALNRFKGQNEAGRKAREYLINMGYDGVDNSGEEYIAFYPEQIKRTDNESPTADPDVRYSIAEPFTDENGSQYESAVLLDTNFFDGISPRNWGRKLKEYVESRSENDPFIMTVQDENGETQSLQFARKQDRVRKNNGKNITPVLSELYHTPDNISKLAVIHIDEIAEISEENNPYYTGESSHGWLDEHGWLHRNANVINASNGAIYNLTFDIARAADGRTILYATKGKIKKVGNVPVHSLKIRGAELNSDSGEKISHDGEIVNNELTGKIVLPGGEEYSAAEEDITESMPRKAADYFTRTANRLVKSLKNTLGADRYDDNGELRSIAREIGAEFISTRTRCSRTAWTSAEMRGIMNRPTKEA